MLYGILCFKEGKEGTTRYREPLSGLFGRGKIVKMNAIRIDKTLPVKLIQLNPINGKVQVAGLRGQSLGTGKDSFALEMVKILRKSKMFISRQLATFCGY